METRLRFGAKDVGDGRRRWPTDRLDERVDRTLNLAHARAALQLQSRLNGLIDAGGATGEAPCFQSAHGSHRNTSIAP